jgi:hypothetical protein
MGQQSVHSFQFRSQTFYAAKNSAASKQQDIIVHNNCVLAQNGLFSFNNGINSYQSDILYEKTHVWLHYLHL